MRSMMAMLLVTASMVGCAAQVPESESEAATATAEGSTASPLRIGRGAAAESCPGGGAPSCVTCTSDDRCVWACAGGYTCTAPDPEGGILCGYSGECRTISFSPGVFMQVAY